MSDMELGSRACSLALQHALAVYIKMRFTVYVPINVYEAFGSSETKNSCDFCLRCTA